MKKIECLPFFNELDLLEIKLETSNDYVDYWIISESNKTYSGNQKPMYLKDNMDSRFNKFKDKIIRIEYECNSSPWQNEFESRNVIGRYLINNFNDNDLVILTDCDEILDYRKIDFSDKFPAIVEILGYYYYINCKQSLDFKVVSIFPVNILRNVNLAIMRGCGGMEHRLIEKAGWHWSFLGGSEKILEKIKAYAHQDLNIPEYSDINKITDRVTNLNDVFSRSDLTYKIVDIDETYPDYIIQNIEKYKKYII